MALAFRVSGVVLAARMVKEALMLNDVLQR
jgi:hypothetical protein